MVYTDEALAYRGLPHHKSVKHSVGQYVDQEVHTNGFRKFLGQAEDGLLWNVSSYIPEVFPTLCDTVCLCSQHSVYGYVGSDGIGGYAYDGEATSVCPACCRRRLFYSPVEQKATFCHRCARGAGILMQ